MRWAAHTAKAVLGGRSSAYKLGEAELEFNGTLRRHNKRLRTEPRGLLALAWADILSLAMPCGCIGSHRESILASAALAVAGRHAFFGPPV